MTTLAQAVMNKMILATSGLPGVLVKGEEQSKEVMGAAFVIKPTWQEVITSLPCVLMMKITLHI